VESLEKTTLFDVVPDAPRADQCAVAVVDPFSTGALLAAEIYAMGLSCIAIYSEHMDQLENLKNLVPQGLNLVFEAVVAFDKDINVIIDSINKLGFKTLAVLPGAETGDS
jgi:hypothetical protein